MDQRRLLLGVGLSVVLLFLYQELVISRYSRKTVAEPPAERIGGAPGPEVVPAPDAVPRPGIPGGELVAPVSDAAPISVETDLVRARIAPVGGRLLALELKQFRETVDAMSPALNLVRSVSVLPLTVDMGDQTTDAGIEYRTERMEVAAHGDERAEIVLRGAAGKRTIEKRLVFVGNRYDFEVHVRVIGGPPEQALSLVLAALPASNVTKGTHGDMGIALSENRIVEKPLLDIAKQEVSVKDPQWAGFAAQYFLTAAIPARPGASATMLVAADVPIVRVGVPSVDGTADFTVFVGPKERGVLTQTGHELGRALDFGWFWFIAVPLLFALRLIDSVTGNYGIAIIVLTAGVKLATMPLTRSTFRNMREMQKIKPHMDRLRERFKDDQVSLQREMMELYKRHRVNPFSGCLPMVLQLPVFVGLYNALSHAIELRHAPFFLWINDLSAPDRLLIAGVGIPVLTLLMGASMFVQQWISPQQGDPAQQRAMMIMPIIFTYMFMGFPAGLVLYWLVNNVLTIGQQYAMLRSQE